jgi:alpha-ketoglutarate-dependent taurine dioxygenase
MSITTLPRTTRVRTEPYGTGSGLLVRPGTTTELASLTGADVLEPLRHAGFLLLRGFHGGMAGFTALVQGVSTSTTLDPAREFFSEVAQKVDAGLGEVGLHTENGNSPFRSHLAWFLCEKAARSGSQTTVCDGYRVWDALSPSTREQFAAQDIVYSRYVAEAQWRGMAAHLLGGSIAPADVRVEQLVTLASALPGTEVEPQPDGGIVYAFRTPAAGTTLFGTRPSFANSILGPSFNYARPRITFADGTEFGDDLMTEVREVTAAMTENLDWQDGDVALIDNTRVMHGRRAITDPERTIYNALSYIDQAAA